MDATKIIKVNKQNLHELYNDPNGNLYYCVNNERARPKLCPNLYELVDGFDEDEILCAMENRLLFIYKEGPATAPFFY